MKCKAFKCPLKVYCELYDFINVKTVGKHFAINPYKYRMGLFTCEKYKGFESYYIAKQEECIKKTNGKANTYKV
jgi:hypothetical protein